MMTVVYVAPSKSIAERIRTALEAEGIMAVLRELGKKGTSRVSVEILVPESEAEDAQAVLFNVLQ